MKLRLSELTSVALLVACGARTSLSPHERLEEGGGGTGEGGEQGVGGSSPHQPACPPRALLGDHIGGAFCAADATHGYWSGEEGGVYRADLATADVEWLSQLDETADLAITTGDDAVYGVATGGVSGTIVFRVPKTGGTAEFLTPGVPSAPVGLRHAGGALVTVTETGVVLEVDTSTLETFTIPFDRPVIAMDADAGTLVVIALEEGGEAAFRFFRRSYAQPQRLNGFRGAFGIALADDGVIVGSVENGTVRVYRQKYSSPSPEESTAEIGAFDTNGTPQALGADASAVYVALDAGDDASVVRVGLDGAVSTLADLPDVQIRDLAVGQDHVIATVEGPYMGTREHVVNAVALCK